MAGEFKRELAPYVGVHWKRSFSGTAELARAAGEPGRIPVIGPCSITRPIVRRFCGGTTTETVSAEDPGVLAGRSIRNVTERSGWCAR